MGGVVAERPLFDSATQAALEKIAEFMGSKRQNSGYYPMLLYYQDDTGQQRIRPCVIYRDRRRGVMIYDGTTNKHYTRVTMESELGITFTGKSYINIAYISDALKQIREARDLLGLWSALSGTNLIGKEMVIDRFYREFKPVVSSFLSGYRDREVRDAVSSFLQVLSERRELYGNDLSKLSKALEMIDLIAKEIRRRSRNNNELVAFFQRFAVPLMEDAHAGSDLAGGLRTRLGELKRGEARFTPDGFVVPFSRKVGELASRYEGKAVFQAYSLGDQDCYGFIAKIANLAYYGRRIGRFIPFATSAINIFYPGSIAKLVVDASTALRDGDIICTPNGSFNRTGKDHWGIYYRGKVYSYSGRPVEATSLQEFLRYAYSGIEIRRPNNRTLVASAR